MARWHRACSVTALLLAFALATASAEDVSFLASETPPKVTNATNQKNITTYGVATSFSEPFSSIQSCLPVSLEFSTANNASVTSYQFKVNSTNLDDNYNLRPFVTKKGVFTLALNGTVTSKDLVNVTVVVPDDLAPQIKNVTATGQSYVLFKFDNVTAPSFQAQIAATGVVSLKHNLDVLTVYASTNGSALLDGNLTNVNINTISSQPVILTNAKQLVLNKAGKGSVFLGTISGLATISATGQGAVSANQTDAVNLIQSGPGSVLLSVAREANISYAGGKNTTFINGVGTAAKPAQVTYYNSGNGSLVFTGALVANDNLPPPNSCINITGFSTKDCVSEAIIPIPTNPQFPIKRPRCKGGSFILRDSEKCYPTPKEGYQCETVPPVSGGLKFVLVAGVIAVAAIMIWINGL